MSVMKTGTRYERKDGELIARRFYECEKCHSRFYKKEPIFQNYLNKT